MLVREYPNQLLTGRAVDERLPGSLPGWQARRFTLPPLSTQAKLRWISSLPLVVLSKLDRRSQMDKSHPKFRNDLIISRQEFDKTAYYVIKDPVTQKFFRIKEFEYFITRNLDGTTSHREVIERFEGQFDVQLPPDTLDKFLRRLGDLGFLEGEVPEGDLAKLQYERRTFPGKLLFVKLKGFDPDRFLNRIKRYSRILFTPYFFVISVFVIILAALIWVTVLPASSRSPPSSRSG